MRASGACAKFFASFLFCLVLPAYAATDLCPMGDPRNTDGERRLALIVGVGEYESARIDDLKGPPNDAQQMYQLLTGAGPPDYEVPTGGKRLDYGFPKENVCLLVNAAATTEKVKQAFDRVLVQGAREGKDDLAVFYYSGHGSQVKDRNGDEADQCDETFLPHDARTRHGDRYIGDLIDDQFHEMLSRLHEKTQRIVVILDSCNSGTATRGPSELVARWQDPDDPAEACPKLSTADSRRESTWKPQAMPGLVAITAASDGTSALEIGGHGIFTGALVEVLTQGTDAPLTYAQVSRQLPPLIRASSYQIPYFQGDLNRTVFGATGKRRPLGWDVVAVGEQTVELSGVPLPGMGKGAELRIYDGAVTGSAARDPANAKATVIVTQHSGINARAAVSAVAKDAPAIRSGDLAILVRPSDAVLKIRVRLRPEGEEGGIPAARAGKLGKLIRENREAALFIELVKDGDSFELSMEGGELVLRGPENNIRNRYADDSKVPDSLWQHARQKALLMLRGEGGADFTDQQTLKVQLVPARQQASGVRGKWKQAPPNSEQVVPLKFRWHVRVTLSADAPKPLMIGALILSSDGSSYGIPCDGRAELLKPGESVTFNAKPGRRGCPLGETFGAAPPLDTQDHVIVFGTQETNPVPWHLMTETARTRSARGRGGPLYSALDRYLRPGTRGVAAGVGLEEVDETTWTLSSLTMRVVEP